MSHNICKSSIVRNIGKLFLWYLNLSNSLPVFLDDFPGRSFGTKTFISGTEDRFCTKNFFSNFFSVGDMDSTRFFFRTERQLTLVKFSKKGAGV